MRMTKSNWNRRMALLRQRAAAGDIAAVRDLGHTLLEGIQDRKGRSLVRRNPAYAARLIHRAAESGDGMAAVLLGYMYAAGMGVRPNSTLALYWDRRAVAQGEANGFNLAAEYRRQGNLRLAHRWFLRAAKDGDGELQ